MNLFRLDGETALITGGGTGIGLGIAKAFAASGARVVILGRREDVLRDAVDQIGYKSGYLVHDVSNLDALDHLGEETQQRFGFISIVVNNAGIHLKKEAVDTTEQEFLAVLNTHLTGAFGLSRRLIPAMKQQRRGNILFMASMTSVMGIPKVVAYAAAKSAYLGVVRTLASELGEFDIRVNAIAPGWIESAMIRKAFDADPDRLARVLRRTPMARMGEPDDIAAAAVYLCSRASKFVTGVLLPVDGGASIGF